MLAARRMMIAADLCIPGLITLPYHNTFSGAFDATFASCDGSTWTNSGGYLQCTDLGGNTVAALLADTGSADMDLTINWGSSAATSHFAGIYFNYKDANNYHMLRGDSGSSQVWSVVAGVATQITNLTPSPVATGRMTRIVLKNGMCFCFDTAHMDLTFLGASDTIAGGTMVGYLTYDTANLFDEILFQAPLYYNNLGALSAGTATTNNAGSQRQCSIFRIATDHGTSGVQNWSQLRNSRSTPDGYGLEWQKADSTGAGDFPIAEASTGQDVRSFALGNTGGAGTWYANITYQNNFRIFKSSDGLTWTAIGAYATSHAECYADTNTYFSYALTGNTSWDNCKTWAFAE